MQSSIGPLELFARVPLGCRKKGQSRRTRSNASGPDAIGVENAMHKRSACAYGSKHTVLQ
jgi:hypothetical protein